MFRLILLVSCAITYVTLIVTRPLMFPPKKADTKFRHILLNHTYLNFQTHKEINNLNEKMLIAFFKW